MPDDSPPLRVFYSYSHADEGMRKALGNHFAAMRDFDNPLIVDWHDRKIPPGGKWDGVIRAELDSADIILLLVSSSFLASKYCRDVEIKRAMERHDQGSAIVVPVFLRSCDFEGTPFAALQGVPRDAKPICNWHPRDEGYLDVARAVRKAVKDLRERRTTPVAERTHQWRASA